MRLSFCFIVCASICVFASPNFARAQGDLPTSTTIVAAVGGRPILYGDIQYPDELIARDRKIDASIDDADEYRRTREYARLTDRIRQMIVEDSLRSYQIRIEKSEVDAEVKKICKDYVGKETFAQEDADRINGQSAATLRLLETWRRDREAGEDLYREQMSKEITREMWAAMKNQCAGDARFELIKLQYQPVTVDDQLKGFRREAVARLQRAKLAQQLVKSGAIERVSGYEDWLDRRVHEIAAGAPVQLTPAKPHMELTPKIITGPSIKKKLNAVGRLVHLR